MNSASVKKVNRLLREVFELEELRPGQREVIEAVLGGEDVLAIMPTGAGKSLCYQLPALLLEGMTVVISPLISLMKDQADKIEEKGLRAANLNSQIPASEQQKSLMLIERERSDFIFATPERLTDEEFLLTLGKRHVDFVVVDEAHCISAWGHDFRPAFLELREAFRRLGNPPVLALTATATPEVVEDIKRQLDCPQMRVIEGGIFRPNLRLGVVHTTNDTEKRRQLIEVLSASQESKIVYCATIKAVNEVAEFLRGSGTGAEAYHGKLSAKTRNDVQNRFMAGETQTIVATNAFGMGIDKPDIRRVVHWQMPGTIEAYYQEAGRAGRDGVEAHSVLLYDTRDRRVQQFFLGGRYPSADDLIAIYSALAKASAFDQTVNLKQLQEILGDSIAKSKLRVGLNLLKDLQILRERRGAKFELIKDDLSGAEIARAAETYVARGASDREKLEQMMLYAQSALCRWHLLKQYFDDEQCAAAEAEEKIDNCGICDNCEKAVCGQFETTADDNMLTQADQEKLLAELRNKPLDAEKITVGDAVEVPKFGIAQVAAVNDDKIEVRLSSGELKTFKQDFLQKIDENSLE